MSKEILSDDLLKESLRKAQDVRSSVYDKQIDQSRQHIFSQEYRKKIKKLENEVDHKKESKTTSYVSKTEKVKIRILLVAIIVMLMGSMTALAMEIWEVYEEVIIEFVFPGVTDDSKEKDTIEYNEKEP